MIFDTHAHYEDERFDADRDEVLENLAGKGVSFVTDAAADMETAAKAIKLAHKYPFIYAAVGVHPQNVDKLDENDINTLAAMCDDEKVLAVGEIGLDYFDGDGAFQNPSRQLQQMWFSKQIKLAQEKNLPIVVHSRDAAEDTLNIIKEAHGEITGGDIHCFSYSAEMAKEFIRLGFYIGIGGIVTFKNSRKIKEVVSSIPIESIVLETDCPYLSPEPVRGQRNNSANIRFVAEKIAEIKQMTTDEVISLTERNAKKLYRLPL